MDKMDVSEVKRRPFYVALYQFLFPLVEYFDGTPSRLSTLALVANLDNSIFGELDSPQESLSSPTSSEQPRIQTQCKDIGPVKRPLPLPQPSNQPAQASRSSSRASNQKYKNPPKPSATRAKRRLSTATDSGLPDQPKKRKRKESTISRDKLKKKRKCPLVA